MLHFFDTMYISHIGPVGLSQLELFLSSSETKVRLIFLCPIKWLANKKNIGIGEIKRLENRKS